MHCRQLGAWMDAVNHPAFREFRRLGSKSEATVEAALPADESPSSQGQLRCQLRKDPLLTSML